MDSRSATWNSAYVEERQWIGAEPDVDPVRAAKTPFNRPSARRC